MMSNKGKYHNAGGHAEGPKIANCVASTAAPTIAPTAATPTPTPTATHVPTSTPTSTPTPVPTHVPTHVPTLATAAPTPVPTALPTESTNWDTRLAGYWDNGECGPHGDNHNWEWCDRWQFNCTDTVTVSTQICTSGRARLAHQQRFVSVGACTYAYYAQYACVELDTRLAAYWDYGGCGPHGDNSNWEWCGTWMFACPQTRAVSAELCPSRTAALVDTKLFSRIDGCPYAYYAQYACSESPAEIVNPGPFRRLRGFLGLY